MDHLQPRVNHTEKDVIFQDEDVCILHPRSERGIVVFHNFPLEITHSVQENGLLLHQAFLTGQRTVDHNAIFFRAPARNPELHKACPTLADVLKNNYLSGQINLHDQCVGYFCIRIDPAKTFVYSSESRVVGIHLHNPILWRRSRRPLREYWAQLERNQSRRGNHYNTLTYERVMHPSDISTQCPPERNAEILVHCNIPPEWRVL